MEQEHVKHDSNEKQPSKIFTDYYAAMFLILIASYVGLALLLIMPMITEIKQINAQTAGQIQIIDNERNYLNGLEQSVSAAESISTETLEKVNQALPAESDIPRLLMQLGLIAKRNNIRADSINFIEAKAAPSTAPGSRASSTEQILSVDINISLRARNYFDVKRFLIDIESNLRLMDVMNITSSFNVGELFYTIQMRTYVYPEEVKIPSAVSHDLNQTP